MATTFPRMTDGSYRLARGIYAYRSGRRWVVLTSGDGQQYETADPDGGAFLGGEAEVLTWARRWGVRFTSLRAAADAYSYFLA